MKNLSFAGIFLIITLSSFSQKSLYDIRFNDLEGNTVALNSFQGKKILVVTVDAASPDKRQLRSLDSLVKREGNNLILIAIPISDFGASLSAADIGTEVAGELTSKYFLTNIAEGKKIGAEKQHPLLQWLTHKEDNNHMDMDIAAPGQMYVIDESGVLYAMLAKKVPPMSEAMRRVLHKELRSGNRDSNSN